MPAYSPERRTALVLCGTGVHGAYHAGVLRALLEAGVKIDIVGGQGVGAGAAALTAVDGASRLWETGGLWRTGQLARWYRWRWPLRAAGWLVVLLFIVLAAPLLVLGVGLVVYLAGFLLGMAGSTIGTSLIDWYASWLQSAFSGPNLPTIVPRVALILVVGAVLVLAAGMGWAARTSPRHSAHGGRWWRVLSAPLDATGTRHLFAGAVEQIVRGGASGVGPHGTIARRYADLLADNLGQPGFRELLLVATDLDTRRDVVAALLREPHRREFMAPRPGEERQAEVFDLVGAGRDYALDILAAALTPPLLCEPQPVAFAPDSFWRGETHRLCDRPAAVARLIEEVAASGVSQLIVVSAVAPVDRPHRLAPSRVDLLGRVGEHLAAAEAASLRDALEMARLRFDSVYVVRPAHNPVGAFDLDGAYDVASDRRQSVSELIDRGYEDAYRQFIEPVVGASGEHLARPEPTLDEHTTLFDRIDPIG